MQRDAIDRLEKRGALRGQRVDLTPAEPPAPSPAPEPSPGFPCPRCGGSTRVVSTQDYARTLGYRRRKRRCDRCRAAFATRETVDGPAAGEAVISPQFTAAPPPSNLGNPH